MNRPRNKKEQDWAIEAYYGIPDKKKIKNASFLQLSEWLSECEKGTTKFYAVEREVYRRKSRDQMWATILGALIGGIFTLVGAFIASPFLISKISDQLQGNTGANITQKFVGKTNERQSPAGTANTKETVILKNSADNHSPQKSDKDKNDTDTDPIKAISNHANSADAKSRAAD